MDYVKAFLSPFLKDRAVWAAVIAWLLSLANNKLHLGFDAATMTAMTSTLSVYAVTHVVHAKWAGGDGKPPTEEELKGKDGK